MQLICHGPDIPDKLLQAHEQGTVVFFCGAGISCPAGLPLFKDLVEELDKVLGSHSQNEQEKSAFENAQYDAKIHQLENRHPDGRLGVRKVLAKILKPNFENKDATAMHSALLTLAKARDSYTRLVTTNFDCIFEHEAPKLQAYCAPLLPIPKAGQWDGVVYLHGKLTGKDSDLDRLVLSSGDFGRAYLTQGWATRFVTELFRNYTVCFVGYSMNDPVMRYMMDAFTHIKYRS